MNTKNSLKTLLTFKIVALANLNRQSIDQKMQTLNLCRTQWQVLARFNFIEQPCSQQSLLKCLDIDRAHLTRTLDQLEASLLIKRIEDPNDKRAKRVCLTKRGEKIQKTVEQILLEENEALLEILSKKECECLTTGLNKLTDYFIQHRM